MNDNYEAGQASARREMRADRWTHETARKYLALCRDMGCENGRDAFDCGYMAEVRALAEGGAL